MNLPLRDSDFDRWRLWMEAVQRAPASVLLVMETLRTHCGQKPTPFPLGRLRAETGLSDGSVARALRVLEDEGFVTRSGPSGFMRYYKLNPWKEKQ